MSEANITFTLDPKFEPIYNYFKSETGNILEIRIELPGKAKMDANYKVVGEETIIAFRGNKMKDEEPKRFSDNLFNKRFFGEFEFTIPLKTEDFCIVKSKEGYQQNGIFIFQFILAPKGSNFDKDLTIKTEEPNDPKFEPIYNYFKSETGNILEIRIELPGKAKMDANYKVVGEETIIAFKGNKMKDEESNRFSDNLFNKRFFGEFEFTIPLKTEDYCIIKSKKGYQQNGIFIFQFILAPKGEITSASTEEC